MNRETMRLREEVARLARRVEDLNRLLEERDRSARPDGNGGSDPDGRHSRRDLLRVAGAAVAGAAGGVLLNGLPAAATDGAGVVLGNTSGATLNDAAHTTSLTATATSGPTPLLKVIGPNAVPPASGPTLSAPLQVFGAVPSGAAPSFQPEGIDGWAASNVGAGVVGASDSGYGVLGETSSGLDLAAFGTGRLFQYS